MLECWILGTGHWQLIVIMIIFVIERHTKPNVINCKDFDLYNAGAGHTKYPLQRKS